MILFKNQPFPYLIINNTPLVLGTPSQLVDTLSAGTWQKIIILVPQNQSKQKLKTVVRKLGKDRIVLVSPESIDDFDTASSATLDKPYSLEWDGYWKLCSTRSRRPLYCFLHSIDCLPAQTPERLMLSEKSTDAKTLVALHEKAPDYSFSLFVSR